MCDPGYYGIDCSVEDTNHYLMDNMRKTWNPYVLFFMIFAAYFTVLPLMGIHRGCYNDGSNFCELYSSLALHFFDRVTSLFTFVHSIININLILILFADLLSCIYYYDTWLFLTIKIALTVALLFGSSIWWKYLQRYNHFVKPRASFYITMLNTTIEIAYSVASIILMFKLTQTHKVISFSYFYLFW